MSAYETSVYEHDAETWYETGQENVALIYARGIRDQIECNMVSDITYRVISGYAVFYLDDGDSVYGLPEGASITIPRGTYYRSGDRDMGDRHASIEGVLMIATSTPPFSAKNVRTKPVSGA